MFGKCLKKLLRRFLRKPIGSVTTYHDIQPWRDYLHGRITKEEWLKAPTGYTIELIYVEDLMKGSTDEKRR